MENAASIVSKFGQALVEELQEISGVGDKIVQLRDELASMNAVLRMLAEADEDCVDHLIREWTKQVRELASDSEDCVDIYKLRVRRPLPWPPVAPGAPLNCARRLVGHAKLLPRISWLPFEKLFLRRNLAADLKVLLARMVNISERRARYGIDREALRRSASFAALRPATLSARALRPSNNPDQFIGLEDQVNDLAKKMRSINDGDTNVKVFSIVGFGGLGKTTLAMEVCRALEADFPHQAQVSVSQAFDGGKDLEGLLKRMLHQMVIKRQPDGKEGAEEVTVGHIDGMDLPRLTNTLRNLLRDKRYLIVIDDVWTIPAWEAIRLILPTENNHNSRILVTTRVESVAKACISVRQVDSVQKACSSVGLVDSAGKACSSVGQVNSAGEACSSVSLVNSSGKASSSGCQVDLAGKSCNSSGESRGSVGLVESTGESRGSVGLVDSVGLVETTCSRVSVFLGFNYFVHHMKPLKDEVSKQLFINRVFGPNEECPEVMEETIQKILKKCGGLPLAIISMASLLASYKLPESMEMWDKIYKSIGSELESNPTLEGMRQIVTLSYNYLPHHLKACMMYLCIFPEDYEIKKRQLLSRWIAEGLVSEKRGLTLLEVAESYFDELVSRNMIIPAKISDTDGRVKSCRVHDIMLEVMVSRSLEANFVSLVGIQQCEGESDGKIRRLSIQSGSGPMDERSVKRVRSLSMFQPKGHHQLLERLGEFTLLRVLDLEECKALQNKHMKHVCRMFLLKYLNLNGTDITVMPKKIGKLVHLQTLSLRKTLLNGLPQSVTELDKLGFLYFHTRESDDGWRLPCGLGRMKALQVLDRVLLRDDGAEAAREIGELTQLRKLNIFVECSQEVLQVLVDALNRTYSLRQLSMVDLGDGKIMNIIGEMTSPPLLLRSMKICGGIDGMPKWFGSLMHLVKLDILWTMLSSDEILGILCELPNLLRLILGNRSYDNDALVIRANYRFPVLKQLSVYNNYAREQQELKFEQGSMAMLEKLEVLFGIVVTSVTGIQHLPSLKEVVLLGSRSNDTLNQAVLQLKSESDGRPISNQFKVVASYYEELW